MQAVVGAEQFHENQYFDTVVLKTSGLYDGSPKTIQTSYPDQLVADPHHVVVPAQVFYVHGLTSYQYQLLIG